LYENQEEIEASESTLRDSPPSPVANIDSINLALRALWNHKSSATYKDLATPAGLHPTAVSQALSAGRDIGLTAYAGKRGLYTFTSGGREYTRALTGGAEAEAKDRLELIILNNPRWAGIIAFLRTNTGVPRPAIDLVFDVERKLSKQWSSGMRANVAQSIVSILGYAGLVKVESGKIVSQLKQDTNWPIQAEVIDRASVRDPIFSNNSTHDLSSLLKESARLAERIEPPRADFADYKDQNTIIRVRKDLHSIATAKSFLDFVEANLIVARKQKDIDSGKDIGADQK